MSGGANQRPPLSDLPFHLKAMFEPRPPIRPAKSMVKKRMPPYTGIAGYLSQFEMEPPPPEPHKELPAEIKARRIAEMQKLNDERNDALAADWDPKNNPNATEYASLLLISFCFS